MELIGCPETSVRNYYSTLRQIPQERVSHLIYLLYDYEVHSLQHAGRNTQRKAMAVFLGALKE